MGSASSAGCTAGLRQFGYLYWSLCVCRISCDFPQPVSCVHLSCYGRMYKHVFLSLQACRLLGPNVGSLCLSISSAVSLPLRVQTTTSVQAPSVFHRCPRFCGCSCRCGWLCCLPWSRNYQYATWRRWVNL